LNAELNSAFNLINVLRNGVLQIWIIKPDSLDHFRLIETLLESTKLMEQEPEGFEFDVRTKLCDVWRIFLGDTKEIRLRAPARNVADTERLKQMMDFIETHYAENISVSDIAAAAGISTRESTRCFQRCISLSPVSYLSDYRVRMAAKLLRTTGKTVIEVSEACGFSSPGYFGRVFKETFSTTPKAYQMGKRGKDIL